MLADYKELDLDLGSFQYVGISRWYTFFNKNPKNIEVFMPTDCYDMLIDKNKHINFKKDIKQILDDHYKLYNKIRDKSLEELKQSNDSDIQEFIEDTFILLESNLEKKKELQRIQKSIMESPFDFPVHPRFEKIAFLDYIRLKKESSWDLWTLFDYIGSIIGIEEPNLTSSISDSSVHMGSLLYLIKIIYDFDDSTIEKYFNNFDT